MINDTIEKTAEKKFVEDGADIRKNGDNVRKILSSEQLESLKRAQIERNNEWIEKMSPVVKYKIQEYVRKQRAKKMQRRKFSLACGLMNRVKQEPPVSGGRKRNRRVNSAAMTTKKKEVEKEKEREPEKTESKMATVTHRRKSAPVRMDMRDLDDLE